MKENKNEMGAVVVLNVAWDGPENSLWMGRSPEEVWRGLPRVGMTWGRM